MKICEWDTWHDEYKDKCLDKAEIGLQFWVGLPGTEKELVIKGFCRLHAGFIHGYNQATLDALQGNLHATLAIDK